MEADFEVVTITTTGDKSPEASFEAIGPKGVFAAELQKALLDGAIDVAVHSLKDLPTALAPGLALAATLAREDPRDALLTRAGGTLRQLPPCARIGTSSLRRRAFMARILPEAVPVELRGNVPTRIERLKRGDYDAIILAAAGLARLGLTQHVTEFLSPEDFPPAVSQGVIGVCARADDEATLGLLRALDDAAARLAVSAERALLARLEGGCQVPLGALAEVRDQALELTAAVCSLDGSRELRARGTASAPGGAPLTAADAVVLGKRIADQLLAAGAAGLIAHERSTLAVTAP